VGLSITGEKLPPERELAKGFGVSRPTIKIALEKLISQGFIEQKQGQGTFVRSSRESFNRKLFSLQ
jgi:GntR family transcriptional repressor for pyruvate dehydrogenase complex